MTPSSISPRAAWWLLLVSTVAGLCVVMPWITLLVVLAGFRFGALGLSLALGALFAGTLFAALWAYRHGASSWLLTATILAVLPLTLTSGLLIAGFEVFPIAAVFAAGKAVGRSGRVPGPAPTAADPQASTADTE